ncbi:MAG: response regulator [Bradymonadia bacterium]
MSVEKKILIVEHEVPVAEGLSRRLRGRGYVPVVEPQPDKAAALFEQERPDLIVISLTLPDDAGRLLCRAIRRKPLGTLVPILFMGTGLETVANVNDAIASGADHWFRKPEDIDALLAKVAVYIGPGESVPAALGPELTPAGAKPPVPPTSALIEALGAPEADAQDASSPREASTLWAEVSAALNQGEQGDDAPAPAGSDRTIQGQGAPRPRLHVTTEHERDGLAPRPESARAQAAGLQLTPPALRATRRPTGPHPVVRPMESDREVGPAEAPWRRAEQGSDLRGAEAPAQEALPAARRAPEPQRPDQSPLPQLRPGPGSWAPAEPPSARPGAHLAPLDFGRAVPLAQRGFGAILAAVAHSGLTGRVEIAAVGVLRRVFVEGGRPVYTDTSDPRDDLAGYLAGEGLLDRAMLEQVRNHARQQGVAVEEVLMEAGYLRPEEIYEALRGYVTERVMALFGLESGESVIIRGGGGALDPVDLGMAPGRLILDGVRRKYGRLRLFRVFGTSTVVPRPLLQPGDPLPSGLSLRPAEEATLDAVDGHRTVSEVARAARVSEVDALAILYGLSVMGVVEAGPGGRRPGHLPPLTSEAVGRLGAPRTAEQMPGFAEMVQARHHEISHGDYYAVLGVPHNATPGEIHAAWEKLKRQFDPHRVRKDGPFWVPVQEIAEVVDDAYAMLSDGRRRALYNNHLTHSPHEGEADGLD